MIALLRPNKNYAELFKLETEIALGTVTFPEDSGEMGFALLSAAKKAADRTCGECNLCCSIFSITELEKPAGPMCKHCIPATDPSKGGGCGIYATRPPVCRGYYCTWLVDDYFGPEWHPPISHMLVQDKWRGSAGRIYEVLPEHDYQDRWREQPYYQQLRTLARMGLEQQQFYVYVRLRETSMLVLPARDVDTQWHSHLVVRDKSKTGDEAWNVILFDDDVQAKRYVTGMRMALNSVLKMSPQSQDRYLNEIAQAQSARLHKGNGSNGANGGHHGKTDSEVATTSGQEKLRDQERPQISHS